MEMINIKERVIEWAQSGGDFRDGLSLFLTFNRNVFYVRNIEAKGVTRGMETLVSEFAIKTKIAAGVIHEMIRNSGGPQKRAQIIAPQPAPRPIISEREKRTIKLREEFPFLGNKDCPDEMAIVVNKMLTAYDDYRGKRERLYEVNVNDREQCYQTAREILDAYILNRQCWDELNHYKIHGNALGKMPEFKISNMRQKYSKMNTVKLVKMLNVNIPRRMTYNKKELNNSDSANKDDTRKRMAMCREETKLIKEILKKRGEL